MNELQVKVNQQPGVVEWNFEDLKKALEDEMKIYEGIVYDDESIATAKADAAMLRKLRNSVEDKRKEIKTACMEPYNEIEKQAKELTALIDKPIRVITEQVNDYEERKKAERKAKVYKYMDEAFAGFPKEITVRAKEKVYDKRWENKTFSEDAWKAIIDSEKRTIEGAIEAINSEQNEEFRAIALRVYSVGLDLGDAMDKLRELRHQQEVILEQQRRRQEEQKRREAEEAAAREAAAKAAAARAEETQRIALEQEQKKAASVTQNPAPAEQPKTERPTPYTPPTQNPAPVRQNPAPTAQPRPAAVTQGPTPTAVIRIFGASDTEIQKVVSYIKFMGLKCEVEK